MDGLRDETKKAEWFVMNAYAKSEHKAESVLSGKNGLPYFIPKKYAMRNYFGKIKRELVPLIPNLVFVKASYSEIDAFQSLYSFLGFATTVKNGNRTPLVVPGYQMENFMKVALHYDEDLTYFKPEEVELKEGDFVRIVGGAFDGAKGQLLRLKGKRGKRLVVRIPQIMAVAATYIEPEFIQVITETEYMTAD